MSLIIDSVSYDIPVISMTRKADFLDKFAERTADGKLHRELIGVYFNYQIQLGSITDLNEYADLWDVLTEPTEFHTVTVPDETGSTTFTAYFASITDKVRKIKNSETYFTGLKVNFIAQEPART